MWLDYDNCRERWKKIRLGKRLDLVGFKLAQKDNKTNLVCVKVATQSLFPL